MKEYLAPSVEILTDLEVLSHLDILLGNADSLDFIPCFASYVDCI